MSFVPYERTNGVLSKEMIVANDLFKVGNIVDNRVIEELKREKVPFYLSDNLFQVGEVFGYAQDDIKFKPCYLTFTFDDRDWMFRGACFEESIINRCEDFEQAEISVKQYCLDKFYSEYIRAVERLHEEEGRGLDVAGVSVIDEYMSYDACVMAGYYLDTYGDNALEDFKYNWESYKNEQLYEPVIHLLEHKDKFVNEVLGDRSKQISSVNDLIAHATVLSHQTDGTKETVQKDNEIEF